ncbi:cyclodeaminase [Halobacillus shinanisalinarum]|uniref:Cyclodeaminase n=1 Tax=Halobacillus shinanisalinarum TaxID=2932258 RepID=A0ABY4H4G1_9BACI|nr:cyclodeaminase [Halobacillus shinanisalinarum]UOQ95350.1 cyclodeaminase [Halobacillus shinanisalinarum]
MRLYTKDEIQHAVRLNTTVIDGIESAFTSLKTKKVAMPPIMRIDIPANNGEVDIKSAYIEGYDSFAVKLSSGFFNNPKLGLPSANGMMILISTTTGEPQAILADNGLLTDIRTAAAGAVATKHLSREDSRTVGIIGTGSQAKYQLEALTHVRPIDQVQVYGRSREKAEQYKSFIEKSLNMRVDIKNTPSEAVNNSDIIITTTPATEPVLKAEWLNEGQHITAMGSDAEHKQELDTNVLEKADLVVCDVKEQSLILGELRSCSNSKLINQVHELGEITSGLKPGRTGYNQITVCDLTGTGVQDTQIARYAYQQLNFKEDDYNE